MNFCGGPGDSFFLFFLFYSRKTFFLRLFSFHIQLSCLLDPQFPVAPVELCRVSCGLIVRAFGWPLLAPAGILQRRTHKKTQSDTIEASEWLSRLFFVAAELCSTFVM